MPKRLQPEEKAAALAAGAPPQSDDYPEDHAWHRAQEDWLARLQPDLKLPGPQEPKRRVAWNALSKKAIRHYEAAVAERAAAGSGSSRDPLPPEPASGSTPAVPASAAPTGGVKRKRQNYDEEWERSMLVKMLQRRGVKVMKTDSNTLLIEKLAADEDPTWETWALDRDAPDLVSDGEATPLPLTTSAAMCTVHGLREKCRELGIEYSITDTAELLQDKIHEASERAGSAGR